MSSIRYIWFASGKKKKRREESLKGEIRREKKSNFYFSNWKVYNTKRLHAFQCGYIKHIYNAFIYSFYPETTWINDSNTQSASWVTKIPIGPIWVHLSQWVIWLLTLGRHQSYTILLHLPLEKEEAMEITLQKWNRATWIPLRETPF